MDACQLMCELDRNPVETIVRLKEIPSVPETARDNSPNLFVYCSTPRPVHDSEISGSGRNGRALYRNNTDRPVGMHSYYNIGWDPRVRRGDPLQTRKIREQQECEKIRRKLIEPRKRNLNKSSRSQTSSSRPRNSDPQQMIRAANVRYARLALSNLRPKEKVGFLVDLADELDQDELCYKSQRIGNVKLLPKVPSMKKHVAEKATQIFPGEFHNFDTDVVPIIERLVGSTCYQARLEVLKEAEQEARQLERDMFTNLKQQEEAELRKYKSRVENILSEEERQNELAEQQLKAEMDKKIGVRMYGGVYVKYGVEEGYNCLGEEFIQQEAAFDAALIEFTQWLNDQATAKIALHGNSNNILDDVIRRVVAEREAQYAAAMWKEVYRDQPLRMYSQEMSPNLVPPPTPGSSANESDEEEAGSNTPALVSASPVPIPPGEDGADVEAIETRRESINESSNTPKQSPRTSLDNNEYIN